MTDSIREFDIAIIGAGAAGLAAAIFAGEAAYERGDHLRIGLLDGASRIGAKILVSGGGRCNVTHGVVSPDDFSASKHWVRNVLAAFNEEQAVAWFASLGVTLKNEDTGKLFPTTDSARTVLDALVNRCNALNVEICTNHRVSDINFDDSDEGEIDGGFVIQFGHGTVRTKRLIMATGGKSLPKTGSDGSGWRLVKKLNHSVTPTYAALVPLVLDSGFFNAAISGVSHDVTLSTFINGKRTDQRTGSLLWTHFGISGPVVMDASRHWVIADETGQRVELKCSCLPDRDFAAVETMLLAEAKGQPKQSVNKVLGGLLPQRVVDGLLAHGGVNPATPMAQLSRESRRQTAHLLTELTLPVVKHRGWNYAEVTAGGVPLKEVQFQDMQSRKSPGLYLIGEMLDCDGRIGGFNFQWAWSTGFLAGRGAAASLNGADIS